MHDAPEGLTGALTDRYSIERELGAGGMATVYLAQDIKHDRLVALKVLRPELAAVIGAERFLAEIKTTANLQHPHILPLHDSGEAEGFLFYVMPYVEGESLRDRLDREKQLPIDDAIRIASEVADALDYAHRHDVIHRDIKPENILLHDGRALVADFGIALAASKVGATRMTETGMSLGTPQYMSPEQAMGEREIDARSDVYALGVVLYEMLSGEPPFTGSTAQAIIARVVTDSPRSLTAQRHTIPRHVEQAVLKSLEKLAADRFATAAEFSHALADTHFTAATTEVGVAGSEVRTPASGGWRDWRIWAAGTGVLVLALSWALLRSNPPPAVTRFSIALPSDQALANARGNRVALSPDGEWLAYIGSGEGGPRVWVRRRDQLQGTPLPGTENAVHVFFGPDGMRVGFLSGAQELKVVALAGGPPTTITNEEVGQVGLDGGTWSDDGYIYYDGLTFGGTPGLRRVRAAMGAAVELVTTVDTAAGETDHVWPVALPGGNGVLFVVQRGISPEASDIAVFDARAGEYRVLVRGVTARYAASGHLVYVTAEGALLAAPFDLGRMEVSGDAVSLADGVAVRPFGAVDLAMSAEGTMLYVTGRQAADPDEIVWVDHAGRMTPVDPGWVGNFQTVALSPDGNRLAVAIVEGAGTHIWVKQLPTGPLTRLTFEGLANNRAAWTPDGGSITFVSNRGGDLKLMRKRADGSAAAEVVLDLVQPIQEGHFSSSGEWLVYRLTPRDIYAISTTGDTVELVVGPFEDRAPAVSPDERWLAYFSDESGRYEVYVRPFPEAGTAKWQVSTAGGATPRWAPDGRTLYFRSAAGEMIAVDLPPSSTFTTGERRVLFQLTDIVGGESSWDVTPDGERFVMIRSRGLGSDSELIMVENLFTELRERVR